MIVKIEWDSVYTGTKIELARSMTDPDELEKISTDNDIRVRVAVASNPFCSRETLSQMRKGEKDWRVRAAIAGNKQTRIGTLKLLAKDKKVDVREALAMNSNIDREIMEKLITDAEWRVRMALVENPQAKDFMETLAGDKDWRVALKVATVCQDPHILSKLAENENCDWSIRKAVAKNPFTALEDVQKLQKDKDERVREEAYMSYMHREILT